MLNTNEAVTFIISSFYSFKIILKWMLKAGNFLISTINIISLYEANNLLIYHIYLEGKK
jgi:hypothetical protein